MDYKGVIIQESLDNTSVLDHVSVVATKVEDVTSEHKTPWVRQWHLHTVEILENEADKIAQEISESLDKEHAWYADFKNDNYHYIIFRGKIFTVDRANPALYQDAKAYGISLGIPEYQVDFAPDDKVWER